MTPCTKRACFAAPAVILLLAIVAIISPVEAEAALVPLANPGFESEFDGWETTDPIALSDISQSGNYSAKVEGSSGRISQTVSVSANTNYTLSAWVANNGTIGATVNGSNNSASGGGDGNSAFELVSVSFNSGSASSITIYGAYDGETARFDDFTLDSGSSTTPTNDGCDGVSPIGATDDGSNDGHGPGNAVDGNSSNLESRWSSEGTKALVVDLGQATDVAGVSIAWYLGNQRSANFSVDTSTNNSNWTSAIGSETSSGSTSNFEDYSFSERSARYVRITGSGNSSNNWNSILEVEVLVCDDGYTPPPTTTPPTTTPPPGGCGFDWSWWALEGANPVQGNGSMVFDALEEFVITPNGNGPRHEAKIDIPLRKSMTAVYEDFEANVTVNLDNGGKTIIAQHHAGDLGTIVKVYIADSNEQNGLLDSDPNDGEFDVYVRMAPAGGGSEIVYPIGVIESGDSFWFRILNDHGDVTGWFEGPGFNTTPIGTAVEDSDGSYLKFGNYLQAQTPELENIEGSENWPGYFEDAGIDTAVITMTDVCHTRIED